MVFTYSEKGVHSEGHGKKVFKKTQRRNLSPMMNRSLWFMYFVPMGLGVRYGGVFYRYLVPKGHEYGCGWLLPILSIYRSMRDIFVLAENDVYALQKHVSGALGLCGHMQLRCHPYGANFTQRFLDLRHEI